MYSQHGAPPDQWSRGHLLPTVLSFTGDCKVSTTILCTCTCTYELHDMHIMCVCTYIVFCTIHVSRFMLELKKEQKLEYIKKVTAMANSIGYSVSCVHIIHVCV